MVRLARADGNDGSTKDAESVVDGDNEDIPVGGKGRGIVQVTASPRE